MMLDKDGAWRYVREMEREGEMGVYKGKDPERSPSYVNGE